MNQDQNYYQSKIEKNIISFKKINWWLLISWIIIHLLFFYGIFFYKFTFILFELTSIFYCLSMFSLTAGYHRLFCHSSYKAILLLRLFYIFFGSASFIGNIKYWCKLHRTHHRFINTDKDPFNIKKGFWYAHCGWIFVNLKMYKEIDVSDLEKDPFIKFQEKFYIIIAIISGILFPLSLSYFYSEDLWGSFLYVVIGRILAVQHAFFLTNSLCHIIGFQPYSDQNSAKNLGFVAWITFGEGYQNFHHEFTKDYRLGPKFWDIDITKWIIKFLSFFKITNNLQTTSNVDVMKAKVIMKQKKLDEMKSKLNFGPEENQLPIMNWETITKKVNEGESLIVIDGIIHDIREFIPKHPGGIKVLKSRIGKDATLAFNGGVYRHTKAARNLAAMLRIGKLPKEEIELRMYSDDFIE